MSAPSSLADRVLKPSLEADRRPPCTFEELAARRDEDVDVARGAALIARDAYARLDVDALLARFDDLAAPLAASGLAHLPPREQAKLLAAHVYETLGFKGNEGDYYDHDRYDREDRP